MHAVKERFFAKLPLLFFLLGSLSLVAPLVALLLQATSLDLTEWLELKETRLFSYLYHSLFLGLGVGFGVLVLGGVPAWFLGVFQFPGKASLQWLLLMPLSVPTYLVAFLYTDWLEYSGPVQTTLRFLFGWENRADYWFPETRSLFGAIVLFSLVLYPYVYLLGRVAFSGMARRYLEVGRSMGFSLGECFYFLALPLARPAILVGCLLAIMEVMGELGALEYFSIPTLSVGIYRTWFSLNQPVLAIQLALLLWLAMVFLVRLEHFSRKKQRFFSLGEAKRQELFVLSGWKAAFAIGVCSFPVVFGFFLPVLLLILHSLENPDSFFTAAFWIRLWKSIFLSALTAFLCSFLGLFLAYGLRIGRSFFLRVGLRAGSFGYAVPGTVMALGVMLLFGKLDSLSQTLTSFLPFLSSFRVVLGGTLFALVFAYLSRFTTMSQYTLEGGMGRVHPNMENAAKTLGLSSVSILLKLYWPLLRYSFFTSFLLIFLEVMKELPLTLLLRPFNFETLATHIYQYASFENFPQAASSGLFLVLCGAPILWLLHRPTRSFSSKENPKKVAKENLQL